MKKKFNFAKKNLRHKVNKVRRQIIGQGSIKQIWAAVIQAKVLYCFSHW